jgi:MFS family permease
MDLICVSKKKIGLIGSSYFTGWTITLLWVPLLADKYGRKMIVVVSMAVSSAAYGWIIFTGNVNIAMSLIFI